MIADAVLLALREIRRNLLRAALTTLGIVIGVAAVIVMVTLGNGASASIAQSIGAMGRDLIILQPGTRRGPGGGGAIDAPDFTMADVETIRREISGLRAVAPVGTRAVIIVSGNRNHPSQVIGTDNSYLDAREWPMQSGRGFAETEIRAGRPVCIIGQTVRAQLFGTQNPVGTEIRVGQVPCEVIGVLTVKGQSTFGQDQDDLVVMPLRTVHRRLTGNTDVGSIWISVQNPDNIEETKEDLTELLRERRRLNQGRPDDFRVNDLQEIADVMESTLGVLTAFLAAIAAISLLVGGIGIMNIMLVSVTERFREIGIRLAIGARERDVLTQFLVEAVIMSALGGLIGIVVGLGASGIGAYFLDIPFILSPGIMVVAVLFSAAIGIAFGYFPARRAARLDPIDALRHE